MALKNVSSTPGLIGAGCGMQYEQAQYVSRLNSCKVKNKCFQCFTSFIRDLVPVSTLGKLCMCAACDQNTLQSCLCRFRAEVFCCVTHLQNHLLLSFFSFCFLTSSLGPEGNGP